MPTTATLTLTVTQADLEALVGALEGRLDLIRDGDSADEAAHGPEWATAEQERLEALLWCLPRIVR